MPAQLFRPPTARQPPRSEEHTSELQSLRHLVCRLLLETKNREQARGGAARRHDAGSYAGDAAARAGRYCARVGCLAAALNPDVEARVAGTYLPAARGRA